MGKPQSQVGYLGRPDGMMKYEGLRKVDNMVRSKNAVKMDGGASTFCHGQQRPSNRSRHVQTRIVARPSKAVAVGRGQTTLD